MSNSKRTKTYWMVRIPDFSADKREKVHKMAESHRMSTANYIGSLLEQMVISDSPVYEASTGAPLPEGIQGTFSPEKDFANR